MHHDPELQLNAEASAKAGKFARLWERWRWFGLFVIIPSLLATAYYGFFAADVYVSESHFVVKAPNKKQSAGGSLGALLQTTGFSSGEDQADEIISYLHSRDALKDLSKRIEVRAVFSSPKADYFSRFPLIYQNDTFENLYQYYGSMVSASAQAGLTTLTVKAYTPEDALALNLALLDLSEDLVNKLNKRVNSQVLEDAEARVETAQKRTRDARIALGAYRNASEILDPEQQGMNVLTISNELIAREAALRAQLAEIQRIAPRHPSIPALRERIAAVAQQVADQTGRAVGNPDALASRLTEYENLLIEQEFATQTLAAANAALEQARIEALEQQYYIERVVEPNLPDDAILPSRIKSILAVIFACLCLYLVGWMLVVGILEHAPED